MTRQQIRRAKRATADALRQAVLLVIALMAVMAFAGCATTGATFRSGVRNSFPDRPPYRVGATANVAPSAPVAIAAR
jgi:hypothetical protein